MRAGSSFLLLYTSTLVVCAQSRFDAGCPGTANKSLLLLGTTNGEQVAAISAAVDAFSSLCCNVSLLYKESTGSVSSPLEELLHRLKDGELEDVLAVLYPGDTNDTTTIIQILNTNILKIPLITFSFPPVPTASLTFPYHIQLVPSEMTLPQAVQAVIDQYGWTRAALLTQDTSVFIYLRDKLLSLWRSRGVDIIHQLLIHSSPLAGIHPDQLFVREKSSVKVKLRITYVFIVQADDVRIYVLNMNCHFAREVICNARHLVHYSNYVWITYGWYTREWWKNGTSECSGDELEEYLNGALAVSHFPSPDASSSSENVSETDRLVHDAVWAVALALNSSSLPNTSREQFWREFDNLSFEGASGLVTLKNGIRAPGLTRVFQYRKDEEVGLVKTTVALVSWTSSEQQTLTEFTYLDGESEGLVWPTGVPSDGTPIEVPHYPFLSLMVLVYLFAAVGLVFTAVCLIFNVFFRNRKLVRLSSPKLNYLIILGAAMLYVSSLGFYYPEGSSPTYISALCSSRGFVASFGYSIAYGTINAKMWRIYYICTKTKPRIQAVPLKDWHLMLVVVLLVLIDSLIAVIVLPLDNARLSTTAIPNKQDQDFTRNSEGIKEVSVVYMCTSPTEPYWIGVLFGYKVMFQAIGVFLAFKIRKVKIRGLNESREVSAILYITSAILVTMIVVSFAFGDYVDVNAAIFGFGLCTATTIVLLLTFGSKMWGLYRDPEGKNVLKGTVVSSSGPLDTGGTGSSQVAALQARIKELEQLLQQQGNKIDQHNSENALPATSE